MSDFNHPVTQAEIDQMQLALEGQPKGDIISHAIMDNGINKTSENPEVVGQFKPHFFH